ncbi:MAG: hypothetical protein ACOYD0_13065 [Candidatus Nanopelagicales bacterium]
MAFNLGYAAGAASQSLEKLLARRFEEALLVRKQQEDEAYRQMQEEKWKTEAARQAGLDKQAAEQLRLQNDRQKRADFLATRAPGSVMSPEDTSYAQSQGLGTLLTQTGGATLPSKQFTPTGSIEKPSMPAPDVPITTTFRGTPEYLSEQEKATAARAQRDAEMAKTQEWRNQDREDRQTEAAAARADAAALRREISGQTAAAKAETAAAKTQAAADEKMMKRKVVVDAASQTLGVLDQMLDEKGNLKDNMKAAIGGSRVLGLQNVPGFSARDAQATIDQLRSRLVVDLMGEMKAQSKTGATGFGALSEKELKVLQDSAGKLDPSQSEAAFAKELKRIRSMVVKVIQEPGQPGASQTLKTSPPANPKKGETYNGFVWDGFGWTK